MISFTTFSYQKVPGISYCKSVYTSSIKTTLSKTVAVFYLMNYVIRSNWALYVYSLPTRISNLTIQSKTIPKNRVFYLTEAGNESFSHSL